MTRAPASPPGRSRARRPRRSFVLATIATLLLGSAALRLGDAGPVLAAGLAEPETAPEAAPQVCEGTSDNAAFLAALQERERRVATDEARLAERMQALRLAEAEIDEKLAALTEAEASLAATLDTAATAADSDIGRLTLVYENMPSAEVAALFEEMEPAFSAGFLARMDPAAAAAIMSNLTPTTAYSISVVIAGRNALVPTE
ncbi:MotE family protein [Wenxinia saemankumensis]|uniref:Flagellar motility protein MotE, a chaperone for MotC folding n=1 Tax=Wenxinia saemankumensis TaxID=1447782 RepID=A0A1M6G6K8_9RHOB|nr:hypothetical protein [Wenxinia saemankumensis]SHJ05621.1 Flagellar motility protein MotE, a chaperone for MotC folding [Wenxinia saemankumensis]